MSLQARTYAYIGAVLVASALVAAASNRLWPLAEGLSSPWMLLSLVVLVTLTGRFPIKLTRQEEASLLVVPLFMGVILLHPAEAVLVATIGTIASERMLKAPAKAIAFNAGANSLAAGLGGAVFFALRPDAAAIGLTLSQMVPALAAGSTVLVTNLVIVNGIVTLSQGFSFLRQWQSVFAFETVQEAGFMCVGLMGALLAAQAWWGPIIIAIPAVLAYYGFRHSVTEAVEKTKLARELEDRYRELKGIQAQLIQSAKLASVGTLAAGIAHEINNPVFAISGRADLLVKGASKHLMSEKSLEYVDNIKEMADRISSITKRLMDYAQLDSEMRVTPVSEVMDAAMTLVGKKARTTRIVREYQEDDVPQVRVVPAQLQQVFVNLLTNALDASADWGTVTLGCETDGSTAVAYVSDTGTGVSQEVLDRLFEPFVTTSKESEDRVRMGLGLYTCHRIVDSYNGDISIETEQGKGTTVRVRLPLASTEVAEFAEEPALTLVAVAGDD